MAKSGGNYDLDNDVPFQYQTPPFPSLYWFFGPRVEAEATYLYRIRDVWRFTLYWTLIVFEAAHLTVGLYAVIVIWWGSRRHRRGFGRGRKRVVASWDRSQDRTDDKETQNDVRVGIKNTGISGMWAVPVLYGLIAGVEAIFAGSVVGWLWVHPLSTDTAFV